MGKSEIRVFVIFYSIDTWKIVFSRKIFCEKGHRFVLNPLTHYATLLGNNFGKEIVYKITLYFIVYFEK